MDEGECSEGDQGDGVESTLSPQVTEAMLAVEACMRSLANRLRYERRGTWDPNLPSWTLRLPPSLPPQKTRAELDEEMNSTRDRLLAAAAKLGAELFVKEKAPAAEARGNGDVVAATERLLMGLFFVLAEGARGLTTSTLEPPADDLRDAPSRDESKRNDDADHKAYESTGLNVLFRSVSEIETQLRSVSIMNILKQLFISLGFPLIISTAKFWVQCILVLLMPLRLVSGKAGKVWKQPIHVYYSIQFLVGVWVLLAATTFLGQYRNWQDTGGHGATWPLMAFLLVLQTTQEATIQKAILRVVGTCLGSLLAWGVVSISILSGWLVPISTLIVGVVFWFSPDSRSKYPFHDFGDISYVCVAFTFSYTGVTVSSYSYGAFPTFITRLVSQLAGSLLAAFVSVVICPVSGVRFAASATIESLRKLQMATGSLIKALEGPSDQPEVFFSEMENAVAHMADVDDAVKLILSHVGSLKAYPILSKVFPSSRKLLDLLFGYSITVRQMSEVLRSLVVLFRQQRAEDFAPAVAFDTALLAQLERQRNSLAKCKRLVAKAYATTWHGPSLPVSFGAEEEIDADTAEDCVGDISPNNEEKTASNNNSNNNRRQYKASSTLEKLVSELHHLMEVLASKSPRSASEVERKILDHLRNEMSDPQLSFAMQKIHLCYVMNLSEVILHSGFST